MARRSVYVVCSSGRRWLRERMMSLRAIDSPASSGLIGRHTKVETDRSPFDGDVLYWASRLGRHPELPNGKAILLKRQHGRCAWCGRLFQTMDEPTEVDHIQPVARQGASGLANRQLLH